MLIRLERHLNVNMTWKLYDIILQYKEMFFETYIRYDLYCKDILYIFSAQRKICFKHIPDITYTLKIYDIVIQYKEIILLKRIPHIAYTWKIYIWYNCSTQRKVCLKHIPYITFMSYYMSYIYDIFAMYITYTLKIYDIVIQYKEFFFWKIYHI